MQFVVAVGDEETYRAVRTALDPDYPYEVRHGDVPSTSAGCDASLMMFPLAAERYGGADPARREAQVLVNHRGDGAPPTIVALPTIAWREGAAPQMQYADWVAWAIDGALWALAGTVSNLEGVKVQLHLEAAAMDERPAEVLKILRQFIDR